MAARTLLGAVVTAAAVAAASSRPDLSQFKSAADVQRFFAQRTKQKVDNYRAGLSSGRFTQAVTTTEYGPIVGVADENVTQYLGIPFAAPPVGPLRWKAPVAPTPWTAPLNTTWWQPVCPQTEDIWSLFAGMDESCLYLNVYLPSGTPPPGGWPIMVFFYGGSWEYGSSSLFIYDGYTDVGLVKDVILVTVNYRLSVLGFMASDALRSESSDGSVGNYGFQDQRFAMSFVQRNSKAFNGDASRITIFGESAGAGSVSNHLVSPRSWGLFQRAITESGPFADWTAQPYSIASSRWAPFAKNMGCGTAGGNGNLTAELACARGLPWKTVLDAKHSLPSGVIEFSPVIDGVEVLDTPKALAAAGKIAPGVDVIFGSNADEGTLFIHAPHDLNATGYYPFVLDFIQNASIASWAVAAYPPSNYAPSLPASAEWWAGSHILGDSQMTCPVRASARWITAANAQGGGSGRVYTYFYAHTAWVIANIADLFTPLGTCHASELLLTFDMWYGLWGEGENAMAQTWVKYWTTFAATGNPNFNGAPVWEEYGSAADDKVAYIDLNPAVGMNLTMVSGLKKSFCDYWDVSYISPSVVFG